MRNPVSARFTIATTRGGPGHRPGSFGADTPPRSSLACLRQHAHGPSRSVLGDLGWAARLSSDDLRGLETIIYTHINPYLWPLRGWAARLDLDRRIDFKRKAA